MTHALVVLLSLSAAVCMAIGIVVRQRATTDVPYELGVSTAMITALLRKRLWWAGTATAVAGYGFQALALSKGTLLLVQPLLVSSLLFALPLSARLAGRKVNRRDWMWALLLTMALAVFVSIAKTRPGEYHHDLAQWAVVFAVLAPVVVVCVLVAAKVVGRRRAALLAVVVGVLFGMLAVLTKTVLQLLADKGPAAVLTDPLVYALLVVGVGATLLQQSAFHAGSLQTSVPTMLVLEPVVAVLLGAVMLDETLAVTHAQTVVLAIAVTAMAAATIALGRDEGAYEEELEQSKRRTKQRV